MNILNYIPTGKQNRISTEELKNLTGVSQRQICQLIETARKRGDVILSCSTGGYWLPDISEPEEAMKDIESFIAYMQSKDTFQTVKGAKNMLTELKQKGQTNLYEKIENNSSCEI